VELQETSTADSGVLINKEIFNQKGKLGTLYEGISNNTTVVVRRLILNRISAYVIEKLEEEINDMKSITNPYLMTNIRVVIKKPTQNKTFDIIMPYISGGSLYSALHEKKINFSLQKKVELAREIAFSMKLLHDQGRIHGHLTPHNILLDSRNILVSDLGMVHLKKYVGLLGNYSNKSAWSSPEVLKEGGNVVIKATTHDDVYSFGMILWEIMMEQEPFPDYSLKKLKEMVGEQGYRPALEEFEVPGVQELIKSCWNINPQSRPTFHLVFSTLNGLISSNLETMMT
jgi:serine/threonine-protein kinase TNNI3K